MEPHEYFRVISKRWLSLLLLTALGTAGGYAYAQTLPTTYTAQSSVFVTTLQGDSTAELVQGSMYAQNIVQSYAALATTPAVLNPVIEKLNLSLAPQQLARSITASVPLNQVIIEIQASSYSPQGAADVANSVASSLSRQASALSPKDADGKPTIRLDTVSPASVPSFPSGPNTRLLMATGAAIGLIIGLLYAFGRELLDTRIRSSADLRRVGDVQVIGTVALRRRKDRDPIAFRSHSHGSRAESYRRIFTNIQFADVDDPVTSVIVTSAIAGEGKTQTALNLAYATAERLDRVLLIDADLRRPNVADSLNLEGSIGLTTVLRGDVDVADAIVVGGGGRPDILPAGVIPPNPGQLLASKSMASLFTELRDAYDFLIIDSPPVVPVMDALPLTRLVDGVIIIARYKSTRRGQLSRALSNLGRVNAKILGVVLNRVDDGDDSPYYTYTPDEPSRWAMALRRLLPRSRRKKATGTGIASGSVDVASGHTAGEHDERHPATHRYEGPTANQPAQTVELESSDPRVDAEVDDAPLSPEDEERLSPPDDELAELDATQLAPGGEWTSDSEAEVTLDSLEVPTGSAQKGRKPTPVRSGRGGD